ncbi:sigma-70 family RNA polymerase sigma factor [Micromonospora sp. WMMD882]|uniref:ECF subfamily RNA polymerase sigma factor, BldN family n=1 Tax=Micromonospora sp. WMMD882 TaxID=3015151 RepID=UPI00248BDEDF|nr:ECF subfamily RNA polymerase sigma factor, BldN family [Micromonospora sp. WMMD882]WBB79047.1 sigma-70 family RNA polymerase sigma factor [Micromonospora sp. WMMD882]
MTTFGYAEHSSGTAPPRRPDDPWGAGARDDDASRRARGRPHPNDPPPRPAAPGNGNARPAGGRVAVSARPSMPAQPSRSGSGVGPEPGRRSGDGVPAVDPASAETAVMPVVPATEATAVPANQPSRPDPSDPATEVWTLVERAQAGETEAFGLLYDRYVDTVFRFVYFRVGNRQLAEDLTSDTFLRALKRIGSFTWQGRDLGAWLVTIARNLVADHFKSGRYRLEVTTGDVLDADREDRGPEGSPEAAVVEHVTNVALLTAVKQLNPEQQECIVLRFLQGFSVAETARAMGKNEGAIKALQYRAVRALARLLPDGFQP